ncbi:MAG: TPM domain-containing protein [Nanoarchaeota archaeon]|nr:TPM domain-containing protein [Nanoarchaeota archaeon]
MRKLFPILIILLLAVPTLAEISTFIDDQAQVLSAQDTAIISSILKNIYDSKQAEYAVVIIQSLEGKDIESYALNLAQGNLGDTEKNNGLLLLIAVEERKYRFEVGRSLEPIFNDAKIGRIGREYLVPNFKAGAFGTGIAQASAEIANELGVEFTGTVPTLTRRRSTTGSWYSFLFFFLVFSSLLGGRTRYNRRNRFFNAALMAGMMFNGRGRGGMGGLGGMGGGFGGGGFGGGGASGGF